jgi:drug/metabolite transporter (DMT)-like permease
MKTALDLRAVVALVVLCSSWGLGQVAIKVALWGIPPAFQLGARSALAAFLVFIWCMLRRKPVFERDGTLWPGLTAGLLFALEFLAIFVGMQWTTASRAVVFIYLSPFVVALGGHFFLGEPLNMRKLVGLGLAFAGLLVAFSDALALPSRTMLLGDLLCVVAAIFWGLTTIVVKGSALARVSAEKTLLYQLGVSAVFGIGLSFVIGESINPGLALAVLPAFLYQAIWVAAITYVAWFALIRAYPVSLLSAFTFLTPLFGVAFGAAVLNEPVSAGLIAALLLVAAGIYLVNRSAAPAAIQSPS